MKIIKSSKEKNKMYFPRAIMMILTVILITLFILVLGLVSRIQGTARVVNYAGLVRGKTQRIVKLENAGKPQDQMIEDVQEYIDGLRNGSERIHLVWLEDKDFQEKMQELDINYASLKKEIKKVRAKGYEETKIIPMSETFFRMCDQATGLAEIYSQKQASALERLEKLVFLDIVGLLFLLGIEIVKAFQYTAQNRILQKKVYLDDATGLPNKNKCEEILSRESVIEEGEKIAVCVFDLNNLRTINNNLGHEKGDEYIRTFAQQLRENMPGEVFVGRCGGDEFMAVVKGKTHGIVQNLLHNLKTKTRAYSYVHPELPISYAGGYALSDDYEACTMRFLFQQADKNMYVDKNRARIREEKGKRAEDMRLIKWMQSSRYVFHTCIYCDARMDEYRILRTESGFFLADDGSYSGAVEQIIQELSTEKTRRNMRSWLNLSTMEAELSTKQETKEFAYRKEDEQGLCTGRITALFVNATADGKLHHFILGFDNFHHTIEQSMDEKYQLTRYYEQLKQFITENGDYFEALMESAQGISIVDLTNDSLKSMFYHKKGKDFAMDLAMPCSYDAYCQERRKYVMEKTLENYRIVDSSSKLLERYLNGDKQVTVEYQEQNNLGQYVWLQKTVLMSLEMIYDEKTGRRNTVIQGIILYRDTSSFHLKEEQEKERLQVAYETADSENRAKTEFMNRMSHDIRTPINGINGMLDIIRKNRDDKEKMDDCLRKIQVSTNHLQALVNDVLEINKIESGKMKLYKEPFDLEALMEEVSLLLDTQITEGGITHIKHRKDMKHVKVLGSPLHLRQILINLMSNSIKYNKPNGQIDTYAQEVKCNDTYVLYEFKIVDTGIGMSRDFIEKQLFEPFTQEKTDARTRYKGSGLGMSIVKGLVNSMHGSIQVKSVVGEGSTFVVRIPFELDLNEYASQNVQEEKEENVLEGLHILLVEDNEINMEVAEFYLENMGVVVEKAWNGKEALDKVKAGGEYDVIMMDLMMPVMDGIEAAKEIRIFQKNSVRQTPILAMTAQSETDSIKVCKMAGMNGYVAKPIDTKLLGMELKKIIRH